MPWTIGEVARLARVSVRTLHHYDDIGLLSPSARTGGNHRQYTSEDLRRLHQILVYRELGFALAEIRRVMTEPHFDRVAALRRQRELLAEQVRRNRQMLSTLDALLASTKGARSMTEEDVSRMFDGFDPGAYDDEARERWGSTDAYRQSAERTSRYGADDWARMRAEMQDVTARYIALMDAGVPPASADAQQVAALHCAHLAAWFYDCSSDMFAGLADLWVTDARFTRNIDRSRAGLAAYQCAAAKAWAAAQRAEEPSDS